MATSKQMPTLSFPHFMPNQVLTDTQLNALRDYLLNRTLETRTHLIGCGIVCGLQAEYSNDIDCGEHYIHLSPGYGLSSRGHLLEILPLEPSGNENVPAQPALSNTNREQRVTTMAHSGNTNPNAVAYEELCESWTTYTHWLPYEMVDLDGDELEDYEPWRGLDIHRLYTAEEAGKLDPDTPANLLDDDQIAERVLVIFLEQNRGKKGACMPTDCNNNAYSVDQYLRCLLIKKTDLDAIAPCEGLAGNEIEIRRLHTGGTNVPTSPDGNPWLDSLRTFENIQQSYEQISEGQFPMMFLRFCEAYEKYKCFLNLEKVEIEHLQEICVDLFSANNNEKGYLQPHYDFIRDFADAFQEFLTAVCPLAACHKDLDAFPRHLMITDFSTAPLVPGDFWETPTAYRHEFSPAAVKNKQNKEWQNARKLFYRMVAMIRYFDPAVALPDDDVQSEFPVRILPSQTEWFGLGERAIPYYYHLSDANERRIMAELWRPMDCCSVEGPIGYYIPFLPSGPSLPAGQRSKIDAFSRREMEACDNILCYNINQHSFLRIDGHLGKPVAEVYQRLQELICIHNLDIEVFVLYFDPSGENEPDLPNDTSSSFEEAMRDFCGLEHTGGVQRGETFILVTDPGCDPNEDGEHIVMADFTVPFRVSCCRGENNNQTRQVAVEVIALLDNTPQAGVDISLTSPSFGQPITGQTDNNGNFLTTGLDENINVQASAILTTASGGVFSGTGTATLTQPLNTITIELAQSTADLTVRVRRGTTRLQGELIRITDMTTNVVLSDPNDTSNPNATTNSNGEVNLFNLTDGNVVQAEWINANGFTERTDSLTLVAGNFNLIDFNISEQNIENINRGIETSRSVSATPAPEKKPKSKAKQKAKPKKKTSSKKEKFELVAIRKEAYIGAMYGFNEAGKYARNRTYNGALDFVQKSQKARALTTGYTETIGKLLSLHNRDTTSKEKKADYQGMIQFVTLSFLDKLVTASPDAIPTEGKEAITKTMENLSTAGIKISEIKKMWKGSALKKETGANSVDQINKMLK